MKRLCLAFLLGILAISANGHTQSFRYSETEEDIAQKEGYRWLSNAKTALEPFGEMSETFLGMTGLFNSYFAEEITLDTMNLRFDEALNRIRLRADDVDFAISILRHPPDNLNADQTRLVNAIQTLPEQASAVVEAGEIYATEMKALAVDKNPARFRRAERASQGVLLIQFDADSIQDDIRVENYPSNGNPYRHLQKLSALGYRISGTFQVTAMQSLVGHEDMRAILSQRIQMQRQDYAAALSQTKTAIAEVETLLTRDIGSLSDSNYRFLQSVEAIGPLIAAHDRMLTLLEGWVAEDDNIYTQSTIDALEPRFYATRDEIFAAYDTAAEFLEAPSLSDP